MIHLHVHSEESQLDGLSDMKALVKRAKEIGSTALAITDHGVCSGIPDFITACLEEGIKPIPGCEAYMTLDRTLKGERAKELKVAMMNKYGLKEAALKDFRKEVRNDAVNFDLHARKLLIKYLMSAPEAEAAPKEIEEEPADLFSFTLDIDFGISDEHKPGAKPEVIDATVDLSEEGIIKQFRAEWMQMMKEGNHHLVLMAMNNQGLEDLYEIISDAHINGFYSDPRTDLKYIRENNLGKHIIATSACLGSWFAKFALMGELEECKRFIQECKDTFHSFYLEKQATSLPAQIELNYIIDMLAVETNTPKVVTSDVHYANQSDHGLHDILVASSMGKCISDTNRLIYPNEFWMKSEEEIRAFVNDDEAIQNTHRIADLIDVTLPKEPLFPKYPVKEGETAEELLNKLSWDGLFKLALIVPLDMQKYCEQLKYELTVINQQGFADYFLIVQDYINAAREMGHDIGPGRGSAAGSLVAFVIGITDIDPIEWELMFERFLNPERAGYPDIDTDFSYEAARDVQMYMKQKYGDLYVAQIGTKGTFAARVVIRSTGKVLGYSLQQQDQFAKAVPEKPGIKLKEAYDESVEVRMYADKYPEWWEAATSLEGKVKSRGVHAGGIVLSPEKLTKTLPLRTDKEGLLTTQYDMSWVEKLLVKFDILKLDTLDLIKKTKANAGISDYNLKYIDLNDQRIYDEIYNQLSLSGIFQCESELFHGIIRDMKPNSVQDISVIVALGRPGPLDLIPSYVNRKWGREKITYPFESLKPVLEGTYGVYVYQEQIMKSSVILGGFTTGQSDILRKAISKKKMDLMEEWIGYMIYGSEEADKELIAKGKKPHNIEGAIRRGYPEDKLLKLKAEWIKFGNYCFNYAHSACYAVLSVQTAYLKTYYPAEFMAALLTISESKKDKNKDPKNNHYMKECENMGIRILAPDINRSDNNWTPVANTSEDQKGKGLILYGMASIAGVSSKDTDLIKANRPFNDFDDFLEKNKTMKLNKTKVNALVKAGTFDSLFANRNMLLRIYAQGRGDSYEDMPTKTSKKEIIAYERDTLGTNVSIRSRWDGIADGAENISFTGFIIQVDTFIAQKTGKEHCKAKLESSEDEINMLVFNKTYMKHKENFLVGQKVRVVGNRSGKELIVNSISYVEFTEAG